MTTRWYIQETDSREVCLGNFVSLHNNAILEHNEKPIINIALIILSVQKHKKTFYIQIFYKT